MSTTRAVWIFVIALTAIRLALLPTVNLSGDEAHYWMWSERLAPAYFSKGPGIAFAMRASTAIFGPTEFGVRFWSPILGAATSLLLYYFARRLFNSVTGFWTVLAINVTPIFNLGNLVMTIDPLSIFFWTAAMITFWLALEKAPNFSLHWPTTGLLVGLGCLCKYTNALQLVSIVLVLSLVPRLRREFRHRGFYFLFGAFAICLAPPIVWNAQHAWATLFHLRSRGGLDTAPGFHLGALTEFLAQHFAIYSPLLFLALVWAVLANWRRARQQFKTLFLVWFGLPVFIFYLLLSINETAAPNWDALAFLSLGILAVAYWCERFASRPDMRKHVPPEGRASARPSRWIAAAFLIGLAASLFAVDTDLLRTAGFHVARRDPADRLRGWKSSASAVEKLRRNIEGELGQKIFVIADERDRASEFSFYFEDKRVEAARHPAVYIPESQDIKNQFSFWPRYDEFVEVPVGASRPDGEVYTEENGINPFVGRTAMYIQAGDRDEVPRNIRVAFQSTDRLATIEVRRFGRPLRQFQVFVCRNYKTLPL